MGCFACDGNHALLAGKQCMSSSEIDLDKVALLYAAVCVEAHRCITGQVVVCQIISLNNACSLHNPFTWRLWRLSSHSLIQSRNERVI